MSKGFDRSAELASQACAVRSGGELIRQAPNCLSLARLLSAPLFVLLVVRGRLEPALFVLCLAGATDLLDGLAARRLGCVSTTGALLDPTADKVFALSGALALVFARLLPTWFVGALAARELVLMAGFGAARLFALREIPVKPTYLGKGYTLAAFVCGVGALAGHYGLTPRQWNALLCATAALALASVAQYVVRSMPYVVGAANRPRA